MPAAADVLAELLQRGLVLGIVSNAQYFTQFLFDALLNSSLAELGFSSSLLYFSYAHGQAKPGQYLFDLARDQLRDQQIEAHQAVYVGNDMLNDVQGASGAGFRTALFAGDRRSLRLRQDDERRDDSQPDLVIQDLSQLMSCL